ncbi:MAG: DNA/RNA non-specific endonuclease [Bacteroidota bacterium]|jgi:endonuclease G|nr:DNA/RNA non-specific endonuclease [Bacteroidota bacterium]HHU96867.1 hypothetical protein [Petrimonas sp.]
MRQVAFWLLIVATCLSSCQDETKPNHPSNTQVVFSSVILEETETEVEGFATRWGNGDQIGLFTSNQRTHVNVPYTTDGSGLFSSATPIYHPDPSQPYDFVAYYPFNPSLSGNELSIDLARDSRIVLYSNNIKGVHKGNSTQENKLLFKHVLPRIYMRVITHDDPGKLAGLTVRVKGRTRATLSLMDGLLYIDDGPVTTFSLPVEKEGGEAVVKGALFPSSPGETEVHLTLNGQDYRWVINSEIHPDHTYCYLVEQRDGSVRVTHTYTPFANGESYTLRPDQIEPGESSPPPLFYMETPVLTSGELPSNSYQVTHMITKGDWLNSSTFSGETRNYTIHYNTQETYPVWVAYPLHPVFMTSGNRTDYWQYDPLVPIHYQPYLFDMWQGYDVSRGHLLPSASRSATRDLNRTTFYFTNMVVQDSKMNSSTWSDLEEKVRYWSRQTTKYDTLYVVTGSLLPPPPETITYISDVLGRKAAKPKYLYKALCRKEKQTGNYYSIAFKMENSSTSTHHTRNVIPVEQIEKETGFTFFPMLPEAVQKEVKKQANLGDWQ